MWLKATKREFRFELGVRPAAEVGDDDGSSDPPLNPTAEEDSKPVLAAWTTASLTSTIPHASGGQSMVMLMLF